MSSEKIIADFCCFLQEVSAEKKEKIYAEPEIEKKTDKITSIPLVFQPHTRFTCNTCISVLIYLYISGQQNKKFFGEFLSVACNL